MQTLVPIGTFGETARKLPGKAGFDDLLEFLAKTPKPGPIIRGYRQDLAEGPLRAPGKGKKRRSPRHLLLPQ